MNEKRKNGILVIVGFLIIGFFIFLLWRLFQGNQQLVIGLIAGLIPSAITVYMNNKNQKSEHRNWVMRNKEAFAIELIDTIISQTNSDRQQSTDEFSKQARLIRNALMVHGKHGTLSAWQELSSWGENQNGEEEENQNGEEEENQDEKERLAEAMVRMEKFIRAFRKDLGHDDEDIPLGEILATTLDKKGRDTLREYLRSNPNP